MRAAEAVLVGRRPLQLPNRIGKSILIDSTPQRSRLGERPVVIALSLQQNCSKDSSPASTLGEQEVNCMLGKGLIKKYLGAFEKHWNDEEWAVPCTLSDALLVFWSHPTPILIMLGLISLGWLRSLSEIGGGDALVFCSVACWWVLQEWVVHKFLLHSNFNWAGKKIHVEHHQMPYFHVTVDGPQLVGSMMLISSVVFLGFAMGDAKGITATWTYWLMGLLYEWCHYLSHTRYAPKWKHMQCVKQNHMMHHCRNKNYWLSFMLPDIDALFGTSPDPQHVPKVHFPQKLNEPIK